MPNIKIVRSLDEIPTHNEWTSVPEFNSKGRLVDEHGRAVDSAYPGSKYRIVEKRERAFSGLELFGRGLLGVGAMVSTGCVALGSKSVNNLFNKSGESIRFAVLVTEYSLSEQELQHGIAISENTVTKIQACMRNILDRNNEAGVTLYDCQANHRVFSLDVSPGLIFKMKANNQVFAFGKDDSMRARYEQMIDARTVVRTQQLGLLVIPNAKLFTVIVNDEEYEIIAERKVDINSDQIVQEQYYQDYAKHLDEAIRQLTIFICKTNFSDVEWRNIPILNNRFDKNGNRKIALIDIEEMSGAKIGLFGGGWGKRGLVRCVTMEQGLIVEAVARQNGIETCSGADSFAGTFAEAHVKRKAEIEERCRLNEFHTAKGITVGNELIQLDEKLIEFPEYPEHTEEIRRMIRLIVDELNTIIANNSSENSVKQRRECYIKVDNPNTPFYNLDTRVIDTRRPFCIYKSEQEFFYSRYMGYIGKKLVETGVVYQVANRDPLGCFFQA
jgi:hypothetical protein